MDQKSFKLTKIVENTVELEEKLRYKNIYGSVSDNLIFDTINSQHLAAKNYKTLEKTVWKKIKLDDNNKCSTSENARDLEENF